MAHEKGGDLINILLLTDNMDTGGAETHIAMLAEGLMRRGFGVAVFSSGGKLADRLEAEGIAQYRFPPIGHSLTRLLIARQEVKLLVNDQKYSILHAHARIPALLLRGCRKWNHAPAPAVTVHAAFRSSAPFSRFSYWGERTIAVSEDLRALVCDRFRVPAETVTVIPNGIDCSLFSPPDTETPPHTVLFASRLDNDCSRGAFLICELAASLAARHPDLRITIAGGGNASSELRKKAERINTLWKSHPSNHTTDIPLIRLTGAVTDMPSLYRSHRIFVGVSRAALEAAACGCAVILCGNEGYGGILSPDSPAPSLSNFCCRGLAPATDVSLLSDLSSLLDSDFFSRTVSAASLAWITQTFSAEQMIDQTAAFYRKMATDQLC